MTSQCPRCGAPRLGDFCHQCGFDFKGGGQAMPPQQQMPPPQPIYSPVPPPQPTYNPPPPPQSAGYYTQAPPPAGYYPPSQQGYPASYPWTAPIAPPLPIAPTAPGAPTAPPADAAGQPTDSQFGDQSTAASAPAQPVSAPSVCLRCYAPLHPGYAVCGNCGFDNSSAWGAAPQARANGVPPLAIALALLGACLIAAAAVLVFVAQNAG
jgi:hypothetical protein